MARRRALARPGTPDGPCDTAPRCESSRPLHHRKGLTHWQGFATPQRGHPAATRHFRSFVDPGTGWARGEKAYKVAASELMRSRLEKVETTKPLERPCSRYSGPQRRTPPSYDCRPNSRSPSSIPTCSGEVHAVIGRLTRSGQAAEEALTQAFDTLVAVRARGAASLTYGERLDILFSALSRVRPHKAVPLRITRINEAWDKLTGEKLFIEATADMVRSSW